MSPTKQQEMELFRVAIQRKAERARLALRYPPMAGGENVEDDDVEPGSVDDEGDEESADDELVDHGDDIDDGDEPEGAGGGDFPWDEFNRLKREQADMAKRAKAAEREAKRQRDKERRESGQYDEIIREKEDDAQEARLQAEAAQNQLETFIRTQRVERIAGRLGFKDPGDATMFIHADDTDDDSSAERALRRLSREKPYLVDRSRATGAPVNGERGGAGLSFDDIQKMSSDEINARWSEVQSALQER